jgi:hypothetical protein
MGKLKNIGYSDSFLHEIIEEDGVKEKKRVIFPSTRYDNVLNRPTVTSSIKESNNSDFMLVTTGEEEVPDAEIFKMFNQDW